MTATQLPSGTRPLPDPARFVPGPQGGQLILSRQEARCLRYVAGHPGSSSAQVQQGVGIRHRSQVSRVLGRLQKEGLVQTLKGGRSLNAWEVTQDGSGVLGELPEGIYA